MSLDSQIKRYSSTAIFCRNHKNLLEEAVAISSANPEQLIAFRAKTVWKAAETALRLHGPRPIYFLPIVKSDISDDLIRYVARLEEVVLYPTDTEATQEILDMSVPTSMGEGLWPDNKGRPTVRTLYLISNCRRLGADTRVHFYDLKKVVDDEDIAPDFHYAYSIVHGHSDLT